MEETIEDEDAAESAEDWHSAKEPIERDNQGDTVAKNSLSSAASPVKTTASQGFFLHACCINSIVQMFLWPYLFLPIASFSH